MSRVARRPVEIPEGANVELAGNAIKVSGKKGQLEFNFSDLVQVEKKDNLLQVAVKKAGKKAQALSGTTRALIQNLVTGVTDGFEKKLVLVGVGYRAQVQGKSLNLTLGLSHPVSYPIPEGITIEAPSQTEVVVKGIDKQKVGQVAAEIRSYRRPEPYKGKGIRYADEKIVLKEAKKK